MDFDQNPSGSLCYVTERQISCPLLAHGQKSVYCKLSMCLTSDLVSNYRTLWHTDDFCFVFRRSQFHISAGRFSVALPQPPSPNRRFIQNNPQLFPLLSFPVHCS